MPDELSTGELGRRIQDLRDDIAHLSGRFEAYVLREVYEAHRKALEERLTRMDDDRRRVEGAMTAAQDNARRAWRLAVTAFIAPLVLLIVDRVMGGGL